MSHRFESVNGIRLADLCERFELLNFIGQTLIEKSDDSF